MGSDTRRAHVEARDGGDITARRRDPARLRVGFVVGAAVDGVDALSGMPHQMAAALRLAGADIIPIAAPAIGVARSRVALLNHLEALPRAAHSPARRAAQELRILLERAAPRSTRRRMLTHAAAKSRLLSDAASRLDLDVILCCFRTAALYRIETEAPVVYFSDATSRIFDTTYPEHARRARAVRAARFDIQREALHRAAASAFAAEAARRSAIDDYHLSPDRVFTIPMGANVLPESNERITPALADRADIRCCIVAADPARKRLDFAIDTVEHLNALGWRATLTHVGPVTRRARIHPFVRCAGPLRLSDPRDRATHQRILRESHLMLLPSLGEAFGIAPCEAAHFATPSVVTETGGLPTVVRHDHTGLILPLSAAPRDHAESIARLLSSPARYLSMAAAAHTRARALFTWDRWAASMLDLLATVAEAHAAPLAPAPTSRSAPPEESRVETAPAMLR
ncbi:MAG: glycosyltransferase family 4 protein [Planctomycetota bacterium]|nr:glycosyltransferase family 4 protein [Planctomycetota bacterium]